MARKSAEPELDYAENTAGTFGSGWTPGVKTGGFPAFNPASQSGPQIPGAAPNGAKAAPGLYPAEKPQLQGRGVVPDTVLADKTLVTARQTVAQMQAQNDFDKRQGFQPTHSDADIKRISDMVNPAKPASTTLGGNSQAVAAPGAAVLKNSNGDVVGMRSPLDTIGNPPKIATEALPSATDPLLGVPTGQEVQPSAAVRAGQTTRGVVDSFKNPASGFQSFQPAYAPEKPIVDVPALLGSGWRGVQRFAGNVANSVRGFASGFSAGGGDRTASGVSNATAAQFQKPTKANPVPVTPTSPTANVDKSQESLSRFGYSEDEFNKRKLAFSGF